MTITVIGHACIDTIESPHGEGVPREQLGGIVYSLATLATLSSPDDTIVPIFGVNKADYDALTQQLGRFPNIDPSAIYVMNEPTNRVMLRYGKNGQSRTECSRHIAPPIPFSTIKPHLNADGILINMVSGFDITLETLDLIRMDVRERGTPIHFDVHSLTLGIDEHHTRFRRPLTDWRRWCFFLNSIQMSEEEAAGLTTERYDEATLANPLMPLMVEALVITRGSRGLTLITQKNKKLTRYDIDGIAVNVPADPTGCGDVFGAAFLWKFLTSRDYVSAAHFANTAAAHNAAMLSPDELTTLAQRMRETTS
jgi:hypothetical protein